jgi:signal transduction histidine kinase
MEMEHLPVDMTLLVREVCQRAAGLALAKAQRMEVHTPTSPVILLGDTRALARLLSILIDNAVKYTPEGGRIRVLLEPQPDDSLNLKVEDSGVGIPSELLSKIFDRFYRADTVRNRNSGGFGLGLAIAKWITNSHRAEIRVESSLRQGTTFTVHFPEFRPNAHARTGEGDLVSVSGG